MYSDLSHRDAPRNYLLVEGSGDIHVFGSLLNYHQIISNNYKNESDKRFKDKDESFEMQDRESIDHLLRGLEVALIEDFVGLLRRPGDVLWPVAEDIVNKVMEIDRRFSTEHDGKARLHTWLAWQKHPGKSMGQSITSKYVLPDCPLALLLIAWFRKLFEL